MLSTNLLWPLAVFFGTNKVLAGPVAHGPKSGKTTPAWESTLTTYLPPPGSTVAPSSPTTQAETTTCTTTTPASSGQSKGSSKKTKTTATTTASVTTTSVTTTSVTSGQSTESTSAPSSPSGSCVAASGSATSLSIPSSAPSNAVLVPASFIGFGFETAHLNNYCNTFSMNLVNWIQQRVSPPLIIRIGGTTGDRVLFDAGLDVIGICVAGDCPAGSSATWILGPSYFDGFKCFPDQYFSFQVPLGPVLNTTNYLDFVEHAYAATGADRTAAIAIGNEPDLYAGQYNVTYTVQDYVTDALKVESHITSALNLTNPQIFEVLDLSSGVNASAGWTFADAFSDGLDSNGEVKYAAQHWYQSPETLTTFDPSTLQTYLMNHSAITSKWASGYADNLAYVQANDPNVSYILSETGSSLVGPPLGYEDGFGAALWKLDFNLYSMSVGVQRVDASQRPAARHSLWVPDTSANNASLGIEQNIGPEVRGTWFAMPPLADFVGKNPGKMEEVLGEDTLTAYAMYDANSGDLSKVALVNLNYWSADTGGARNNFTFNVPVPQGTQQVEVRYLQSAGGAHTLGYDAGGGNATITYAGETWSYILNDGAGSLVAGVPANVNVTVCNGIAPVTLQDTEAAIVFI